MVGICGWKLTKCQKQHGYKAVLHRNYKKLTFIYSLDTLWYSVIQWYSYSELWLTLNAKVCSLTSNLQLHHVTIGPTSTAFTKLLQVVSSAREGPLHKSSHTNSLLICQTKLIHAHKSAQNLYDIFVFLFCWLYSIWTVGEAVPRTAHLPITTPKLTSIASPTKSTIHNTLEITGNKTPQCSLRLDRNTGISYVSPSIYNKKNQRSSHLHFPFFQSNATEQPVLFIRIMSFIT